MSFLSEILDSIVYRPAEPSPTRMALANLDTWEYSIPLTTQWVVRIEPVAGSSKQRLLSNIGIGTQFDTINWNIPIELQNILFANAVDNDVVGTFFARGVSVPGESFDINVCVTPGAHGYIPGVVGGERSSNQAKRLDIEFIGTNLDFVETIIRPWIITGSYLGLIARPPAESIKCNIVVVKYTRGLREINIRPITTMYQFFDCMPIFVGGEDLSYDEDKIVLREVNWIYNNYATRVFNFLEQY